MVAAIAAVMKDKARIDGDGYQSRFGAWQFQPGHPVALFAPQT
jgi:hypothetical protein